MNFKPQLLWTSLLFLPFLFMGCIYVDETQLKNKGMLPVIWERGEEPMEKAPALFTASEQELFQAVEDRDTGLALELLDRGADPEALNDQEESLYEVAFKAQMTPLLDQLIEDRVPIIGGDAFYITLVLYEITYLKKMLAYSNIDQHCRDGSTPLITAVNLGDPDLVELLLKHGASPDFANLDQRTPLEEAAKKANKMNLPDVDFNYGRIDELLRSH